MACSDKDIGHDDHPRIFVIRNPNAASTCAGGSSFNLYVLIVATPVTTVGLLMNAWVHELHQVLGLCIPLIVVNCLILGRAEARAAKQGVVLSALDGLATGAGYTLLLTTLGALREAAGSGTLFAGASTLLLGDGADEELSAA